MTGLPLLAADSSIAKHTAIDLYESWIDACDSTLFSMQSMKCLISGTNGPWFNALQIDVRDGQDQPQSWTFHPAPITNEVVQLNSDSGGGMLWWLTPGETAQLTTGTFAITATLNTTNVTRPGAWKGLLAGVPVSAVITNEPALLDRAQTEQKGRLFADYALLKGDRDQAQREIDALLTAYPTNIGGLTYNAYLKQAAGLFDDAVIHEKDKNDNGSKRQRDAPKQHGRG